jgi:putative ABC transport system permease protein
VDKLGETGLARFSPGQVVAAYLIQVAALAPAVRAARLSAVQAIATGRAPRASGGYAAHRLLGRDP